MKLWLDDLRPAPEGYMWCKTVNEAKNAIVDANANFVQSCKSGLRPGFPKRPRSIWGV